MARARVCRCGLPWHVRRLVDVGNGRKVAGYWCIRCDEIPDQKGPRQMNKGK